MSAYSNSPILNRIINLVLAKTDWSNWHFLQNFYSILLQCVPNLLQRGVLTITETSRGQLE
jgi:hypothetical protein